MRVRGWSEFPAGVRRGENRRAQVPPDYQSPRVGPYSMGQAYDLPRVRRLTAFVLFALLALVFLTGFASCGAATNEARPIIKSGSELVRGTDEVVPHSIPRPVLDSSHLPTSTSYKIVVSELENAETEAQARQAFADLREGDLYDRLLSEALCTGMEGLAEQDESVRASEDAWRDFLYSYPEDYADSVIEEALPSYRYQEWVDKVDGATTAWDLAQVNGRAAQMYWNACVVR